VTIHQLRIYEIDRTKRVAFHARFRDHAVRIMESYDFRISAMWESDTDGRLEFIYLQEGVEMARISTSGDPHRTPGTRGLRPHARACLRGLTASWAWGSRSADESMHPSE